MPQLEAAEQNRATSLNALVNVRMLLPVQNAMARTLRTSLTVCDAHGDVFGQSLQHKEDLHGVLTRHAEVLRKLVEGATVEDPASVPLAGDATVQVVPLVIDDTRLGAIVAGPIWKQRPTVAQVEAFLSALGSKRRAVDKLVESAAVASPDEVAHIRETLRSMAEVVAHMCAERQRQQRAFGTLSTLNRIGRTVSSQLSLQEVLEDVLAGALDLLKAEEGSIMLTDERREEMRIVAARGLSAEIVTQTRVKVGDGISGQVALEGRARLLKQGVRETDSRVEALKSAMSVPLIARDAVIGVLNIKGRQAGGDFTEEDLAALSIMASQAAGAIANAKIYEAVKKRATEMDALFSIGTAINSELERNQVLQRVLDHAIALLDSRKGSIMLLNEETRELQIEVAYGVPPEILSSVRLRLGEGVAGRVAEEGQPRLLLKGEAAPDSRGTRERHSALCVPLVVREHAIGVINVSDKRDGSNFNDEHLQLLVMLANQAAVAIENAKLHDDLHSLFVSSITALANAIDARDPYTRGHSERVAVYSVRVGERIGMSGKDLDFLRYAALLHDVGKINVRDEILNKPGRLTEEEFAVMKRHPEYGAAIMMPVKAFQKIIPFMFYHHEKYCAGGGYPLGLSGDAIPLEARIIAVVDAYDAMTSHRPYRRALSIEQAVQELLKHSGTQFDPKLVDVFLQILEEDPVFARSGIEASIRAEKEGWIRSSVNGTFSPRGGAPVSPRPRVPSTG